MKMWDRERGEGAPPIRKLCLSDFEGPQVGESGERNGSKPSLPRPWVVLDDGPQAETSAQHDQLCSIV